MVPVRVYNNGLARSEIFFSPYYQYLESFLQTNVDFRSGEDFFPPACNAPVPLGEIRAVLRFFQAASQPVKLYEVEAACL